MAAALVSRTSKRMKVRNWYSATRIVAVFSLKGLLFDTNLLGPFFLYNNAARRDETAFFWHHLVILSD